MQLVNVDRHYKLIQRHGNLDTHKLFFAERIIKAWNSFPANNDTFKSLATFKSFVNSVSLTNFASLSF